MTRVSKPDKDDWHKLMCLMSWIKQMVEGVRTIGADSLLIKMLMMIDSSHVVHKDMHGHTGES